MLCADCGGDLRITTPVELAISLLHTRKNKFIVKSELSQMIIQTSWSKFEVSYLASPGELGLPLDTRLAHPQCAPHTGTPHGHPAVALGTHVLRRCAIMSIFSFETAIH